MGALHIKFMGWLWGSKKRERESSVTGLLPALLMQLNRLCVCVCVCVCSEVFSADTCVCECEESVVMRVHLDPTVHRSDVNNSVDVGAGQLSPTY